MMRIQYDFTDAEWERVSRYSNNPKLRHEVAKEAHLEWVTKQEGRDKKLRMERLLSDAELLAPVMQYMVANKLVTLQ